MGRNIWELECRTVIRNGVYILLKGANRMNFGWPALLMVIFILPSLLASVLCVLALYAIGTGCVTFSENKDVATTPGACYAMDLRVTQQVAVNRDGGFFFVVVGKTVMGNCTRNTTYSARVHHSVSLRVVQSSLQKLDEHDLFTKPTRQLAHVPKYASVSF